MSNTNMRIWDQVGTTDPSATKNFTGMGGFRGTAIKPTYLMRKATEVFGPCGEGWGWTVLEDRFDEGGPLQAPTKEWPDAPRINAKLHTLKVQLWYLGKDGQKCTVEQYGHTPFVHLQQGKIITDWEAAKKSLTDAIGKCLQPLGFAADIHLGLFDDAAYVDAVRDEVAISKADDRLAEEERQKQERLDYLKNTVESMQGAQSLYELKKIHDSAVRRLAARKDDTGVQRIAKELADLTPKFKQESAA
ncbi:hypothetical protein [Pseudomonas alabamensis]|uniref:hypothetical protein n=1 Tax=Pseudomonas alabamensis TaxID=3064349 RepID=UPI000A4EE011